ncbi:MAG: hypothetical protein HRU10_09270 [Opitutales bacterium]|nr:hypothetical protein [Opitutales bacterium]
MSQKKDEITLPRRLLLIGVARKVLQQNRTKAEYERIIRILCEHLEKDYPEDR